MSDSVCRVGKVNIMPNSTSTGTATIEASLLPELARIFGVGVDELLGLRNGSGKRGPTPKFQKQLERIAQFPRAQQRLVMQMLDGVLAQSGR